MIITLLALSDSCFAVGEIVFVATVLMMSLPVWNLARPAQSRSTGGKGFKLPFAQKRARRPNVFHGPLSADFLVLRQKVFQRDMLDVLGFRVTCSFVVTCSRRRAPDFSHPIRANRPTPACNAPGGPAFLDAFLFGEKSASISAIISFVR